MPRHRVCIAQLGLLVGWLSWSEPSLADKASPAAPPSAAAAPSAAPPKLELEGPEAEAKDRARVLFGQGVTAYREGRYYDAVEIFLATQRIYPDTQLSFNVARAYENLGNVSAALRYYRDYLRQADRPSDGADVKERVRRLERQLAERSLQQLTVLSQPEGATVLLDGKPIGITPFTVDTYPGKHRVALALSDYAKQEQIIELEPHAARDAPFLLVPLPKPAPPPAPSAQPKNQQQSAVHLSTLLTLGTGALLLGGSLVAQAASSDSGISKPAAFLAGGGLGVTTLGGLMLYFDLSPRSKVEFGTLRGKDSALSLP